MHVKCVSRMNRTGISYSVERHKVAVVRDIILSLATVKLYVDKKERNRFEQEK